MVAERHTATAACGRDGRPTHELAGDDPRTDQAPRLRPLFHNLQVHTKATGTKDSPRC